MAKVTSKLQLTVPKAIAVRYGIRPGDELEWVPAGDAIRVFPEGAAGASRPRRSAAERLRLFREVLGRQRRRERKRGAADSRAEPAPRGTARGWRREDLYTRGRTR